MRGDNSIADICVCECSSCEHQIVFQYDKDSFWEEVCCSIHLTDGGFWHRLKYGIKYIFGYKCKYGAFDEFIWDVKDISKIEKLLKYLKLVKKNSTKDEA